MIEPRRGTLLALLIGLVAAAGCVYLPLFRHPRDLLVGVQNGGQNDLTSYFLPARLLPGIVEQRRHVWPAWNPWTLGGKPHLGNPQTAALYPPYALVGLTASSSLVGWLMVAHVIFGGLGTWFYCRRRSCGAGASSLAAVGWVGAPFAAAQIGEGHVNQVCLAGWIPWVFLGFERWRAGEPLGLAAVALSWTMALLCGHPQEAVYLGLLMSLWIGLDLFTAWGTARGTWERLRVAAGPAARWLGVVLLTAGLAAVELLPTGAVAAQSVRRKIGLDDAEAISLGPQNLRQLLDPTALGGPANYAGPGLFYWETLCHFGIVPLFLALAAVLQRGRSTLRISFAALFGLLFAFGPSAWIYSACHYAVPGVALFRAPSRMLFLVSFLVVVLAAEGVQAWLRDKALSRPARVWSLLPWAAALAGLAPAARPYVGLFLCCAAGAAGLRSARPFVKMAAVGILVVGTAAELSRHAHQILRTVPRENLRVESPVTRFVRSEGELGRVLAAEHHLTDDEAIRHEIHKLPGYEPLPLQGTAELFDALWMSDRTGPEEAMLGFHAIRIEDWNKPLLDILGVRYVVTDGPDRPGDGWTLKLVGKLPQAVTIRGRPIESLRFAIYENPNTLPRAYVVGRAVRAKGFRVESMRGLDPRREVLYDGPDPLPPGQRTEFLPATVREYGPQRVVVEAELDAPGILVLTDTWAAGWTVRDDFGTKRPLLRVNLALRGVPLEAGRHRLTFAYAPPLLIPGALASLLAAAILGIVSLRARGAAGASGSPQASDTSRPDVPTAS